MATPSAWNQFLRGRWACPACSSNLVAFGGTSGGLHDCKQCGGQFVDNTLLKDLLERKQVIGAAVPSRHRKANPLEQPLRYLRCPQCQQQMNRRNFGGVSGIIVETCRAHGVWFDRGELPRILAWVKTGGLAEARYRTLGLYDPKPQARDPVAAGVDRAAFVGASHEWASTTSSTAAAADGVTALIELFTALFD